MDLARSVILLSGVVFHAAFLYSPGEDWFVDSSFQSPVFDHFIAFIRSFRMEALFIVSGFFSALLVSRRGNGGFIRNRAIRMGVPLLFCGILLNTAMTLISDDPTRPNMGAYVFEGQWQLHLWNIGNLLAYELVLFSLLRVVPQLHSWLANSATIVPWLAIPAYLVMGPLATRVWSQFPDIPFVGILVHTRPWAEFLPAYLMGYALHQNARLRNALFQPLFTIPLSIALWFASRQLEGLADARLLEVLGFAWRLSMSLVLFGSVRALQSSNPWIKRISIASYTIYIVHLPLQIALFHLIDPHLANYAGFMLIILVSFSISWAFHVFVIERIPVMGFLFNGKVFDQGSRSF